MNKARRAAGVTSGSWARVLVPAAVGAGLALVVLGLRLTGLLDGFAVLGLFGATVLALPTSASLSRRILLILPPILGFVPLLWWLPDLFTIVDYGTFLLALSAGVFGGWVAWASTRPGQLRRLLPKLEPLDALPVLAGVAVVVTQLPMLTVGSASRALSLLSLHWDNASHFTIFSVLQANRRVIPLLGDAADGSRWSFQDYPQGYHAVLATASQLAFGPAALEPEVAVLAFAQLSALMTVVATVLVAAGLTSLPVMRRRPAVALPIVTVVVAAWALGPGSMAYLHGFPNFHLGVAMVVSAVLLVFTMEKPLVPLPFVSLGGATVGVAQNWVLLLVLLVPLPLILFCPRRRVRWRAPWTWWAGAAVTGVLTVMGVGLALWQISSIEVQTIIEAAGGVPRLDPVELALVFGTCLVLSVLALRRRGAGLHSMARARLSLLVLTAGTLFIVWLGSVQLAQAGTLSYYVLKFSIGFELVAVVLGAVALAVVLARRQHPRRSLPLPSRVRFRTMTGSLLAALVATQMFGSAPGPWYKSPLGVSAAAQEVPDEQEARAEVPAHVEALLRAVKKGGGESAMYLTTEPSAVFHPLLAQQWYSALTGTYTEGNWELSLLMFPLIGHPEAIDGVVAAILAAAPDTRIIIDP